MSNNVKVKVSMNLLQTDVDLLKELAKSRGTTVTDVVRQAIAVEKFLDQSQRNGEKLLIEDKDKRIRELVMK